MSLQQETARSTRAPERILADLERAWSYSDRLFELIPAQSLLERPIALRHPLIFYVGHLPAFAWNILGRGVLGYPAFQPDYDALFEFGIDPHEDEELDATPEWPELRAIKAYRDRVRELLRGCLPDLERRADDHNLAAGGRALSVVLEHEVMHHETLLYLFHELDFEHKRQPTWWTPPIPGQRCSATTRRRIPAGRVRLGAEFADLEFGWDNEFPSRESEVAAFELDDLPVTIDDFRSFVEAGGYQREELWSRRGWDWRTRHAVEHPVHWRLQAGTWFVRTMFAYEPLEEALGWPVCVTWNEADAYARWKGARLPTEQELHRAAYGDEDPAGPRRPYPWGAEAPTRIRGNVPIGLHGLAPVGSYPQGASPFGVQELLGGGWEWTSTVFDKHAGFRPYMAEYPGYSQNFFDGEHYVLFGGSWATDPLLMRRTFRNWFRHNYPYPFTQFRLAWPA